MRVSVSASINYYYEVKVDDELCAVNADGDLINEIGFLNACYDADPIVVNSADNVSTYILSVCNDETGEELYAG